MPTVQTRHPIATSKYPKDVVWVEMDDNLTSLNVYEDIKHSLESRPLVYQECSTKDRKQFLLIAWMSFLNQNEIPIQS